MGDEFDNRTWLGAPARGWFLTTSGSGDDTVRRYVGQVKLLRPDRVPSLRFRGFTSK